MTRSLLLVLMVALGGALGSMMRYGVSIVVGGWMGAGFYGILTVNVLGCFAMGVMVGVGAFVMQWPEPLRVFLMVGTLGGFTTFSSFSLDVLTLVERDQHSLAIGYIFASVVLCLLAVFSGVSLVKALS